MDLMPGDRVRVKTLEELHGMVADANGVAINAEMRKFCGKYVTVEVVFRKWGGIQYFGIKEDLWNWSEAFLKEGWEQEDI